ncbi:MAG: hypothetical protein GEV06_07265 [Luteitalea sp.]|nr:hypothetical protein [Luteitalea sp.]
MIAEPDVTLTDYALAVECAVLARLVAGHGGAASGWFALFFAALGIGAAAGGTVHGFPGVLETTLWLAALLALGVGAWAATMAGVRIGLPASAARWVARGASLGLVLYAVTVTWISRDFALAIVGYLPAVVFLFAVFAWRYARDRAPGSGAAMAGLALTLAAAAVQHYRIAPPRLPLDHNALYHLVQAVALFLIYRGARQAEPLGR